MMQRTLWLADILPMSVSVSDAVAWICSLARLGAKWTNPAVMPTTSVTAVKIAERLLEGVFMTFAPDFDERRCSSGMRRSCPCSLAP